MSNKSLSVSFPTLRFKSKPDVLTIKYKQERYNHDTGALTFRSFDFPENIIVPGTPLMVKITSPVYKTTKSYPCYVHHVRKSMSTEARVFEVYIIGASYVMKQKSVKVWKKTTVSQIAKTIAKKYKFAADITPHPRVFSQIAQNGESDFEFLVKCAKKCGYMFRVDRTTLIFKPIDEYYKKYANHAPVFTLPTRASDSKKLEAPTMNSFVPIYGEDLPFADATKSSKSFSGVNPITKKSHKYTKQKRLVGKREKIKPAIFDSFDTNTVTPGIDIAKSHADAFSEMNKFPYRAVAEVRGNPNVMPGTPVFFNGVGQDFSGYWIPLSVEHHIYNVSVTETNYVMTMEVGIDSLGKSNTLFSRNLTTPTPTRQNNIYIEPNIRQIKNLDNPVLKTVFIPTTPNYSFNFGNLVNTNLQTSRGKNEFYSFWSSNIADVRLRQNKPFSRSAYVSNKVRRRCCL